MDIIWGIYNILETGRWEEDIKWESGKKGQMFGKDLEGNGVLEFISL